jgi:hypothetical protein
MLSMPIAPRALRLLAAAVLLHVLTGCYRYVPADPVAPSAMPSGASVRLYLTPQGMTALEPRLGPRTAAVIGRVGSASDGGLTLLVAETRKADGGAAVRWIGEQVTIPAATIARAERRVLDRRRTVLASVGGALAVVAAFVLLTSAGGEGSGNDGGGPTPTP